MTDLELRLRCHTFVSGHPMLSAADQFAAMADWCRANDVQHDIYGEGALINGFERKVADLLGFEAGLFVMTGTMAQCTALRLACEQRGSPLVAMHSTSHIVLHERSNYQLLDHFKTLSVGTPFRPWTAADLQQWPDRIGAALYELPMREIGGQLPSWEELNEIKAYCREHNIHLHMDGARLWEAAAGYGRSLAEVAAGFDSVYVSFYKGIGGLSGAMLLGSAGFIARADMWVKRQGGNLHHRSPYVVAAAMRFDERLARMPAYLQRTQAVYEVFREFPALRLNPWRPHCNLFHVHVPAAREAVQAARNQLAGEQGIWLFNAVRHGPLANESSFEWYVGDSLLEMSDERLREVLRSFLSLLRLPA